MASVHWIVAASIALGTLSCDRTPKVEPTRETHRTEPRKVAVRQKAPARPIDSDVDRTFERPGQTDEPALEQVEVEPMENAPTIEPDLDFDSTDALETPEPPIEAEPEPELVAEPEQEQEEDQETTAQVDPRLELLEEQNEALTDQISLLEGELSTLREEMSAIEQRRSADALQTDVDVIVATAVALDGARFAILVSELNALAAQGRLSPNLLRAPPAQVPPSANFGQPTTIRP